MLTVPSRLVPLVLRLQRRNRTYRTPELALAHLAELTAGPRRIGPPDRPLPGVLVEREDRHGWPIFRVSTDRSSGPARGRVLYFHGGAYVHGIHAAHWRLLAHLVARTGVEAVVPMYPLLPEGGTAAAVAEVAVRIAREEGDATILMGDSAGGQIAFSTALGLRDVGIVAPLTVLIAPPIDLELRNPGLPQRAPLDPWLCRDGLVAYTQRWLGDDGFEHPLNPIHADPTGLGRIVVFTGTLDILNLDVQPWVARLGMAGVDVECHEAPGEVHVYPLLPTRAGRRARARIVELIEETLPAR